MSWLLTVSGKEGASRARHMCTAPVTITLKTPTAMQLPRITEHLSSWQADPWAGHLHPGDLGWRTLVGAGGAALSLRVWSREDRPVAVGMVDDGVLRMALDPAVTDDELLVDRIAEDLGDPESGLFGRGEALVEARGAHALRSRLQADGWTEDDPWTPLICDLTGALDLSPLERTGLRIEQVGLEAAETWTGIHWSAFRGTPYDERARDRFVRLWSTMMTGPLADRALNLIGYEADGEPVAIATVWTAGHGRPGLIEPLGVHRDHRGHGYGRAITVAAARALQDAGASSANVATENSRPAAIATYLSAGFRSLGTVTDLRRPQQA